ncbi:MAG: DNA-protecting protein DprA [Bdellovibrio sp.]|nr:MAG: DNA-protecting protein DprA [Bdellovibrio sp.]
MYPMSSLNNDEMVAFAVWSVEETRLPFGIYEQGLVDFQTRGSLQALDPGNFAFIIKKSGQDWRVKTDEIRKWREKGVRFLVPSFSLFPKSFRQIHSPPRLLYYHGSLAGLRNFRLAIVGSREPSGLSLAWIENEIGDLLERQNICIVSGGARGIDQAAHRMALRKNRATAVFLPSGLFRIYPGSLSQWIKPVVEGGGVFLSEYAPYVTLRKSHFAQRNRLIAGLAQATLIMEARPRSGTLLTAQQAVEQGRPLFVVPSHPYDGNSQGGLHLLSEGATMVVDARDLLAFVQAELQLNLLGIDLPPASFL